MQWLPPGKDPRERRGLGGVGAPLGVPRHARVERARDEDLLADQVAPVVAPRDPDAPPARRDAHVPERRRVEVADPVVHPRVLRREVDAAVGRDVRVNAVIVAPRDGDEPGSVHPRPTARGSRSSRGPRARGRATSSPRPSSSRRRRGSSRAGRPSTRTAAASSRAAKSTAS